MGCRGRGSSGSLKQGPGAPPAHCCCPSQASSQPRVGKEPHQTLPGAPSHGQASLHDFAPSPPRCQLQIPSQPRWQRHPLCPEQSSHPTRDLQPSWEAVGGGFGTPRSSSSSLPEEEAQLLGLCRSGGVLCSRSFAAPLRSPPQTQQPSEPGSPKCHRPERTREGATALINN